MSLEEFKKLLNGLELTDEINWDHFIYLIAKTGMRFAEALAITPNDFDFVNNVLSISRSLNYKNKGSGFMPTKTTSSARKVSIDGKTSRLFQELTKNKKTDEMIFVKGGERVFNSTANSRLFRSCKRAGIPAISIHGLRHTHASILFYKGASILSVSKRLGHANVNVTQNTYLHIIRDLEDKDAGIIEKCFSEGMC